MQAAVYDLATAMKEAGDAAIFARKNGNSMANVKAAELRAKLSGLLIDRVLEVSVDLTGAIARAEQRVQSGVTPSATSTLPSAFASLDSIATWRAQIPGDRKDGQAGT